MKLSVGVFFGGCSTEHEVSVISAVQAMHALDTEKYQVTRDGTPLELTKKEYELLVFMAKNQGTVYSREQLLEEVWGYEGFYGDTSSVDVTVSRLRAKLEVDAGKPQYLFTKRGMGYYIK